MKKVLVFSNEFPPDIGGAGVVAKQYACALSLNGHDVTVLTRKRKKTVADGPYKIVEVPVFSKLWFLSYRKVVDFDSFELIILNDPAAAYVAGLYFSTAAFSKSVVFLHGSEPELIYGKPSITLVLSFFRKVYTSSLKRCDKIYAVSNYMKNKFISRTGMSRLQDKISVKYAGVDSRYFYPEPNDDFRAEWRIPEDAVLLLSASRVVKDKGYGEMFRLFRELSKEGENLYWIVVGGGKYLEELKTLTKANCLCDKIIFVGQKNREELRGFYSNVDVFWLLSNYDEAFVLTYIEAQMCGIPVIGRNRAGAVEAVFDGVSGFLVDNEDQVRRIIKDKLYKNLAKSDILDFSRKFQIENNIDAFII